MGLSDDFQSRYSADRVLQLTNPDSPAAVSVDTARLAAAAADAQSKFETVVGVSYNPSDADHVAYAVPGVVVMLRRYGDGPIEQIERDIAQWTKSLEQLRLRKSAFIPLPQTTSNLVPTREATDYEVRPVSDRSNLGDMIPRAPRSQLARDQRSY